MVNTGVCGTLDSGSIPDSRPKMFWIIPLLILIFFEAIADVVAKEWSLGARGMSYAFLALLCYMLANTSWLIALKRGAGLTRGAILFSVSSAILASIIGVFFYKEHLENYQILGAVLGIVSIVLVCWE